MIQTSSQSQESSIEEKLQKIIKDFKIVGLSALVVDKTKPVWEGYYGLASIEAKKRVNPHTVYRIASVSKMILGVALMQLYEKGKFKLEDDISDHLGYKVRNPHFPDVPINFIHLLTHTSSLQDEYTKFVFASYCNEPPSLKEVLFPGGSFYTDGVWGNYEPGSKENFLYSNLASVVLGTLVECLSGERYDVYCRKNIFKPLGMDESSFNIEDLNLDETAVLYEYNKENQEFDVALDTAGKNRLPKIDLSNYIPGTNGGIYRPQGGLYSNARDLSKFLLMCMNDGTYNGVQILKKETLKLITSEHWQGVAKNSRYRKKGLNFQITDAFIPGKVLIGHCGDAWGLLSGLYFDEEREKGLIFLTSGSEIDREELPYSVEKELIPALYSIIE